MASVPQPIQNMIADYLQRVGNQIKINKVILFGSYANGQFTSNSDIDLAVFSDDFLGMEPIERFRFLFLQAADYELDLQPLAFTISDLSEPAGIVAEILNTGLEIAITN
ncbi:nucleotidyltransferase domain-containing protein [Desulfosporosinus metallidurans]|uniref:DNA polymerase, beta domain protein region n=1 Tax=Desulfosporosinus metallidurans TaxID=1888891 RepID=A0A1Q8QXL0_9FIRM|nr:nucleotidyltransferase domain-containing protein [Desulfosporosinus metallidurans]OLN32089.1 DNA polymerase, beta domain protein region [Desulfosporosinus metallidurans]